MILAELNRYYDRLVANPDPDTGRLRVPEFGYSDEKIGYVLLISREGELVDVVPNMDTSGKKPVPRQISVPRPEKRTSGIQPNFLWDKSAYVLGVQANPDKKSTEEVPWLKSQETFEAFKAYHQEALAESDDEGVQALLRFLENWLPEQIDQKPAAHDLLNANLVFQLDGDRCYLHDRAAIKQIWTHLLDESNQSEESTCLVTGAEEKIARLHPSIKGVYGGQSSGGSIVSFNSESYESYGKTQGENAPVSELAAFKYTTALNYLLNRDNKHCFSVADASTVFWAVAKDQSQAQKAESLFGMIMNPGTDDDSEATQLRPLVEQLSKGRPLQDIAPDIDPDTRFYVLGLAPNAARLSIRYWLDTSFGELQQRLAQHYADLALEPLPWKTPPSIWRLLIQLAPNREGQKAKSEEIPSHLAGELMRSVLTGTPYPRSMIAQLLIRIRSDGHINALRVAMVKAVLQREFRKGLTKEEVPMSLDIENTNEAYLLGRLFAVLERIQSSAIKEANATITDRYFASASTVPFSVFPRLLAGSKNHLAKIRKDKPGYAVNLDKDMTHIIAKLPSNFCKHLSIEDQGKFTIGYYQQREHDFTKKASESQEETA
jgi:CRISPR-associated protein Csd1